MTSFLDAVIVTGAGRGLGRAVAKRCGQLGILVLCISKTTNAGATCEEILSEGGKAESLVMDLADLETTERRVAAWIESTPYRHLAAVLAAGVLGQPGGLTDGDLPDWLNTYLINVLGNFAVLKGLLPRMLQARFGRVVTLAGGGAAYAYPLFSGYALSKTAMVRATENLHEELKDKGDFVTVCLAPGAMETDMLQKVRAACSEVRTAVAIEEPVQFIQEVILAPHCGFSGRYVHVRDEWRSRLSRTSDVAKRDLWLLRRVER